jgi:tetratricopeptide (TPR) repeat protein/TolB-like protein
MNMVTGIGRLLAEFRRRHVFRVAAVYLAAAFVALQLVDLLVEPLGLPAWTMGLLIILIAVGFILALILAWAFELTPEGMRRTVSTDTDAGPEPGQGATATQSAGAVSATRLPPRLVLVVAALVVISAGAWLARSARAPGPVAEAGTAIAVLPFHVTSAEDDLAYLREGLAELLTGALAERAGMPTVSQRLLLRELRDVHEPAELETRAPEVVRRLGSVRYITGEVVGRSTHLTVSAALVNEARGDTIRASVSGPETEINALVERLAAQLLAGEISWIRGQAGSLADVPLPALREYLEGASLQRQGRFAESLDRFRRALEIDSTFALAAFGFEASSGWSDVPAAEVRRVQDIAWQHRHRLGAQDRLQLEGMLGPAYPEQSAPLAHLAVVEDALRVMPDRAELWVLYGDLLFHDGQAIGAVDWRRRAITAFERASTLAPEHPEAEYHLLELMLTEADAEKFNGIAHRLLARDSVSDLRRLALGAVALHEDTPSAWDAVRAAFRSESNVFLMDIANRALHLGRGLDEVLALGRDRERAAVTVAAAEVPVTVQIQMLANMGRPGEAAAVSERHRQRAGGAWHPEHLQLVAWTGWAWDGDTVQARMAMEELRSLLDAAAARPGEVPPHPFHICTVAIFDVLQGRTDWATRIAARLEADMDRLEGRWLQMQAQACPVIVRAGLAHVSGTRQEALAALRDLEAYLTGKPFGATRMRAAGNFVAAALHEFYDDHPAALAALRRLQDTGSTNLLSTALREEGRMLEQLGRTGEAADVYRRYLSLRRSPEPAAAAMDDAVRGRLAALERPGR